MVGQVWRFKSILSLLANIEVQSSSFSRISEGHSNRIWQSTKECLLDMENLSVFPRIRSIHDAFTILKEEQPEIGIGEPQIRELIRPDKLRSIEIGNRHYIAPESFTPPYCYRLSDCATPPPRRTPPYRRDAMAQFNELIAKNQHFQSMGKN